MWTDRQICILNVGMNHKLASGFMRGSKLPPVFEDLSFVYVPIPESEETENSVTYADLGLEQWVNDPLEAAHYDPEFETFTYGDYSGRIRTINLYKLKAGDLLFFFANFQKHDGRNYLEETGFHFIGFFELAPQGKNEPPYIDCDSVLNDPNYNRNAHCRRDGDSADIFKGTPNSMKFHKAVPYDKALANKILPSLPFGAHNKAGRALTDLSVINSATKAARLIEGDERKVALEEAVKAINPEIQI